MEKINFEMIFAGIVCVMFFIVFCHVIRNSKDDNNDNGPHFTT